MAKATIYSQKDKAFKQFPIKCEPSKEDCEITHKSWGNYTGENMDRRNAEHCENFCPKEEVWSNSTQTIVKSKDVNWI